MSNLFRGTQNDNDNSHKEVHSGAVTLLVPSCATQRSKSKREKSLAHSFSATLRSIDTPHADDDAGNINW